MPEIEENIIECIKKALENIPVPKRSEYISPFAPIRLKGCKSSKRRKGKSNKKRYENQCAFEICRVTIPKIFPDFTHHRSE